MTETKKPHRKAGPGRGPTTSTPDPETVEKWRKALELDKLSAQAFKERFKVERRWAVQLAARLGVVLPVPTKQEQAQLLKVNIPSPARKAYKPSTVKALSTNLKVSQEEFRLHYIELGERRCRGPGAGGLPVADSPGAHWTKEALNNAGRCPGCHREAQAARKAARAALTPKSPRL